MIKGESPFRRIGRVSPTAASPLRLFGTFHGLEADITLIDKD